MNGSFLFFCSYLFSFISAAIATWTWIQPTIEGSIAPRTSFGAAVAENKFFVIGGQGASGLLNDTHFLDLGNGLIFFEREGIHLPSQYYNNNNLLLWGDGDR